MGTLIIGVWCGMVLSSGGLKCYSGICPAEGHAGLAAVSGFYEWQCAVSHHGFDFGFAYIIHFHELRLGQHSFF